MNLNQYPEQQIYYHCTLQKKFSFGIDKNRVAVGTGRHHNPIDDPRLVALEVKMLIRLPSHPDQRSRL